KDWLGTGTGNLKIQVRESVASKKTIGSVKVVTLQITRKPDKHSSRLAMMAHLRRTENGYQNLGFPEATLTFDTYTANGKFVSRSLVDFIGISVESYARKGNEEIITFIAESSSEFAISNIEILF
ncbi:MAG: hypothetical protein ABI954_04335, partial [Pyrinomonadaceae bacterium]